MKYKVLFLSSLLTLVMLGSKTSAASYRIEGDILVQLAERVTPERFLSAFSDPGRSVSVLTYDRPVGRRLNIHLFHYDPQRTNGEALLEQLRRHPLVTAAQFNYQVEYRSTTPDDPEFVRQWGLPRIGAPEVWDVTTGGTTALGDEIVIAILDDGIDVSHRDLVNNIWANPDEVPNDGIDNDGNGYVDDTKGWNFVDESPQHRVLSHGTSVTGLLGARGNNGTGVTGVNWGVKVVFLDVSRVPEIIAAYEYVVDLRERYNKTQGREGAFVVATNASIGISKVFCEEQPLWGQMYDLLGQVGVLSVAGAPNNAWDVEEEGDMPTTCPSEFLVTVLNTNIDDERHQGSGWGAKSIDMGAPGNESYSTKPLDSYGIFSGNSAAVPHLTGSIALLYSLPCPEIAESARQQPSQTALSMRQAILAGVDPLSDLAGITVTGGRLNIFNAMERLQQQCGGTSGPLAILQLVPNPADQQLRVVFETPDFDPYEVRVFNTLGQIVFRDNVTPSRFASKSYSVPTWQWAPGVYYFSIHRGKERVTKPFVVQH